MKQPKLNRTSVVDDIPFGLYVWEMPDGRIVGDDEGNWMNIPAQKGDRKRIAQITEAARYYGITEGKPKFLSGNTRVTDEEREEQELRMKWGLVPDKNDLGNAIDELKHGTL